MKHWIIATIVVGMVGLGVCQDKPKPALKPKKTRKGPPPTHADVAYDQHNKTKIDFWNAEGPGPHPVLVYIHGGGWIGGDKNSNADPTPYLKKGSPTFRSTTDLPGKPLYPLRSMTPLGLFSLFAARPRNGISTNQRSFSPVEAPVPAPPCGWPVTTTVQNRILTIR